MNKNIEKYKNKGFIYPIKIISDDKAKEINKLYNEEFSKIKNNALKLESKFKSHLIFKFLNEIIYDETFISYVREILGNNILCWNSIIFSKPKKSGKYVGWHRDKEYWNLKNDKVVTVSIAITESNIENGCLKIYDGNLENLKYTIEKDNKNMLARGQNAVVDDDDKKIKNVELKPGESAFFNQSTIHGSDRNNSEFDRTLIAIRYISTDNYTKNNHKTATLVSGVDEYNFYEQEPLPINSFDKNTMKFHSKLMSKQSKVFANEILAKFKLEWLSFILNYRFIRGLYYFLKKMN